jgi:hypothetical protein
MTPPVTRMQIAEHVSGAFTDTGMATKAALVVQAQETGSNEAVLSTLLSLPDKRYANLNELWATLPDMPVE